MFPSRSYTALGPNPTEKNQWITVTVQANSREATYHMHRKKVTASSLFTYNLFEGAFDGHILYHIINLTDSSTTIVRASFFYPIILPTFQGRLSLP